nr:MobA/MobL family protein [Lachnospiraceae bacterium]
HNPPVMDDHKRPLNAEGNPTNNPEEMIYRNPHCHIMLTVRPIAEDGSWEAKSKQQYVCIRDGENGKETKNFTAEEFKTAQADGWKKQYQFKDGKDKIWLTQEEGELRGLERVNKFPKTIKLQNEKTEIWNSRESLLIWRERWAVSANEALEEAGKDARIDHRSYADQGLDQIPTVHMGPRVMQLEKEGNETDIGSLNRQIKAENSYIQKLREQLSEMVDSVIKAVDETKEKAKSLYEKTAHKLESIRARFIGSSYRIEAYDETRKKVEFSLKNGSRLTNVKRAEERRRESERKEKTYVKKSHSLQEELAGLSRVEELLRGKKLQSRISDIQLKLEKLHETDNMIYRECGFDSADEVKAEYKRCLKEEKKLTRIEAYIRELRGTCNNDKNDFRSISSNVSEEDKAPLDQERIRIRGEYEEMVQSDLQKEFGAGYDQDRFTRTAKSADKKLSYDDGQEGKVNIHEMLEKGKEEIQSREEGRDDVSKESHNRLGRD